MLDLFCGAGGATRGYQLAGWHVTGVDIHPQPNYCGDEFHQADALTFPLDGFDAIHASPCCQHHANVTKWRGSAADHADLLTPMRAGLAAQPLPYVIENVPEALPAWDLILCGSQFGLSVRRHRGFLLGGFQITSLLQPCWHRADDLPFMHKGERAYADAMGCDWMTNREGRQAIPPSYTEFIGAELLAVLAAEAVA